jgi:hypothetical protein
LNESFGGDWISCGDRDTCAEAGNPLCSRRQRSNDVDSSDGEQLTDLLEADLGISRRDGFAYGGGLDFYNLRCNSIGNPKLLKKFSGQINAAVAIGDCNGFCRE